MSEFDLLQTVISRQLVDDVLEVIHEEWLLQSRQIRIALEHNEYTRAQMAMGAEIACEALERRILNRVEARQRIAGEKLGPKSVIPSDATIAVPKVKIGNQRFHRAR